MLWLLFAMITAIAFSIRTALSKKLLRNADEYIVSWATMFFGLPFIIFLFFFTEIPKIDKTFWTALIIGSLFNLAALIMYMKSIKKSPLSLTIPFLNFTPLLLLFTSLIMLGEFPGAAGLIGIFLIVLGAYVLNIRVLHKGFLAPFKLILKEQGSMLMLIVAVIYAITSNIDKIAVLHSSSIFYVFASTLILSILFLPIISLKSRNSIKTIKKNLRVFFIIGFLNFLIYLSQMIAIKLTLVSYVISVKRTSALFSVILGYFFFQEKNFKQSLIGAIIMVIGVILITLS